MTNSELKKLAKEELSKKRYKHEKNVAAAARMLAERYGANPEKAEMAAWLHDIVKEKPKQDLLQMLNEDAIIAGQTVNRPFAVWHGPCAAIWAKNHLGIREEEVLSAVACHTTGKAGMSLLDKVVYVADMISADRDYPGVEKFRALAEKDLDTAMVALMEEQISINQKRGKSVDAATLAALRDSKQTG